MIPYDRCFITGCDTNTEWTLRWFFNNFKRYNKQIPIVFCDFGVSEKELKWAELHFDQVIPFEHFEREATLMSSYSRWMLKPLAAITAESNKTVWLDTDCEVLGDIQPIFDLLVRDKINIVRDDPWTRRRGELWHNTGVFGIVDKPKILFEWASQCRVIAQPYSINRVPVGDQDALHELIGQDPIRQITYINELPNKYNWLRIQLLDGQDDPNKLVMHWTGPKGKQIIHQKIHG